MVSHERVADDVYFFQSDVYAQVTAGVVVGPNWAVVIDTLAFPEESLDIRDFVEQNLKVPVRYVINTHYHADHSWGNCFFPGSMIISSELCRNLLDEKGRSSLDVSRKQNPNIFRKSKIVLPQFTFDRGELGLRVGKKTLVMVSLPGHSPDGIGVLVEEDRVLFSGDVFMPVPYIVDGDIEQMVESLNRIVDLGLENVVQGHGDIVLRGEIEGTVDENVQYLKTLEKIVKDAAGKRYPLDYLESSSVEETGKSRVIMGGLAEELHRRNLISLYRKIQGDSPLGSEEDEYYYENYDNDFEDEEA